MKNIKIFIILLIIAIAGTFAYLKFGSEDGWICADGQWVMHGNPDSAMPETGCGNPADTNNITANPQANIVVTSPSANQNLTSPFHIIGQGRVFENQFNYRLKKTDNTLITEGTGYANAPDIGQFGPFDITVSYTTTPNTNAILEVFDYSAKDGTPENLVSIPVVLQ